MRCRNIISKMLNFIVNVRDAQRTFRKPRPCIRALKSELIAFADNHVCVQNTYMHIHIYIHMSLQNCWHTFAKNSKIFTPQKVTACRFRKFFVFETPKRKNMNNLKAYYVIFGVLIVKRDLLRLLELMKTCKYKQIECALTIIYICIYVYIYFDLQFVSLQYF